MNAINKRHRKLYLINFNTMKITAGYFSTPKVWLRLIILSLSLAASMNGKAQVGFNNPNPDSSSVVDIAATNKGFLIPRVSSAQRSAMKIGPPALANSLMVFDTDSNAFFYYSTAIGDWVYMTAFSKTAVANSPAILRYGNLGIGVTNPTAKVDISGTVRIADGTEGAGKILTSDATGLASWTTQTFTETDPKVASSSSNKIPKWNGSTLTDGSIIDSAGFVGIGSTSPSAKLNVAGNTSTTNIQITNGAANGYVLKSDATGNASWVNSNTLPITEVDPKVSSSSSNKISKWNGTSLADGTITDSAGFIGIGTTSPTHNLHIAGSVKIADGSQGAGKLFTSDANGVGSWQSPAAAGWGLTGNSGTNPSTHFIGTTDNQPIVFRTINAEKVRIDTNGNVGIGIANPLYKLDVNGNFNATKYYSGGAKVLDNDFTTNSLFVGYTGNTANTAIDNTFAGILAGAANSSGNGNTGFGRRALASMATGSGNTALGANCLRSSGGGLGNTAVGSIAMESGAAGSWNVAVGYAAMWSMNSGLSNTAVGSSALGAASTTNGSTAVGGDALKFVTTGSFNTAVGYQSSTKLISGGSNSSLGYYALRDNTIGSGNTAMGTSTFMVNTTGSNNTAIGAYAGYYSTTGSNCTFVGAGSGLAQPDSALTNASAFGASATVGASNSMVLGNNVNVGIGTSIPTQKLHVAGNIRMEDGNQAAGKILTSDANGVGSWQTLAGTGWGLTGNSGTNPSNNFMGTTDNQSLVFKVNNTESGRIGTVASGNTSLGYSSLRSNTGGGSNTAIGLYALDSNSTGSGNTAIGANSLRNNTSGNSNIAIGNQSLSSNSTGHNNIGIGYTSLQNNTSGLFAVGIGGYSLSSNISGNVNTAVGYESLLNNTTGDYNTALGGHSAKANTSGYGNTSLGYTSLFSNTSGYYNTAVGAEALYRSTGFGNTALGRQAGANDTTGTQNTYIGFQSEGKNGITNATAIGANAYVAASNSLVLGNNVNVGIGTTNPQAKLDVSGNALINGMGFGVGAVPGLENIAIGGGMNSNTTGYANTSVGNAALASITTGNSNTAIGQRALVSNTTGADNTSVGLYSSYNTTGNGNVAVGNRALELNTTGNNNVAIGNGADVVINNLNNAIAIGKNAKVGISNSMVLGDSSVNVGIGTAYPSNKLHVAGTVKITDGSQGNGKVLTSDANGVASWQSPAAGGWGLSGNSGTTTANFIGTTDNISLRFRTNNSEFMTLDSIGRLFIGSQSYTGFNYKLNISNEGNTAISALTNYSNIASANPRMQLRRARGTSDAPAAIQSGDWIGAFGMLGFDGTNFFSCASMYSDATENWSAAAHGSNFTITTTANGTINPIERIRIDNNGYVGIGTLTPTSNLHISDNSWGSIQIDDKDDTASIMLMAPDPTGGGTGGLGTTTNHDFPFFTNNVDRVTIKANGNVGIGTSNPVTKFEVAGGDAQINGVRVGKGYGSQSTMVGDQALLYDSSLGNTAMGYSSLGYNTYGQFNTAVGHNSLSFNTTGEENTAVGQGALMQNQIGNFNTAIGWNALWKTGFYAASTYNVGLGVNAGYNNRSGSNNTFIGTLSDANDTALTNATAIGYNAKVNISNAMVLGSNANVGIGTSAPTHKLHVAGTLKIADGTQGSGKVLTSDSNGVASWQSASASTWGLTGNSGTTPSSNFLGTTDNQSLVIKTNNTERMRVDSSGDVQVGDYYTSRNNYLTVRTAGGNFYKAGIGLYHFNDSVGWLMESDETNASFAIKHRNASTFNKSYLTVLHDGKVGVGTTSPSFPLELNTGTGEYGITHTGAGVELGTYIDSTAGWFGTKTNHPMYFYTNDGSSQFTLTPSGNAGIGTTTPSYKLEVANGDASVYGIRIGRGGGNLNGNIVMGGLGSTNTGWDNTAIGYEAMLPNTTGNSNTALGSWALRNNTTGNNGTALGLDALKSNTTGSDNCAAGAYSMYTNTTGYSNATIGNYSLYHITTGFENSAVGSLALYENTTGGMNSVIGAQALWQNTTGQENIAMGYYAGNGNSTGSQNTYLGGFADATVDGLTNATAVGYNAKVGVSNALVLGANANIGIGTSSPTEKLHVNQVTDANKQTIYVNSAQTSTSSDYQNRAVVGLAKGGNFNWGYAFGVSGVADQANSYYATGVYAGLGTTAPSSINSDQALYANGNSIGYAGIFMNGNVGIGSAAPGARLHVATNASTDIARFESTGGTNCYIAFTNTGSTQSPRIGAASNDMVFRTNAVEQARLDVNGNFGIGTTAPSTKLHVKGSSNSTQFIIDANATQSNANPLFKLRTSTGTDLLSIHSDNATNIFIGNNAGLNNSTGSGVSNVFIGESSGKANTTGNSNVFIGVASGMTNTTGYNNVALGENSFKFNTTGNSTVAIGMAALAYNTTGYWNTAVGHIALSSNTTGYQNTGVGFQVLLNNTTGNSNTAVGLMASQYNTTGNENVSIGELAGYRNATGNYNTAIGTRALYQADIASNNTALGYRAGDYVSSGGSNTFIGYLSNATDSTLTNATAIGANATVSASNCMVLGNGVNVGIGISNPTYKLQVNGQPAANGFTLFTNYSDSRLKENIKPLEGTLERILKLNPVEFNYNNLSGLDEASRQRKIKGFVAQEVKELFPDMVGTTQINGTEYFDLNISHLLPYMVKAMQQMNDENQKLKAEVEQLKLQNNELNAMKNDIEELKKLLGTSAMNK